MRSFLPVKKNGTIGVLAPAFPADTQKIEKGIAYLISKGFKVKRGQSLSARHLYFSGSDELRVTDLENFFRDPKVDMILCARGGWGTLRLLDRIDYHLIAQNPKPLVGYSDITTLQLAFLKKANLPSFSGPMVAVEMAEEIDLFTEQHFWQQIFNPHPWYNFSFAREDVQVWRSGKAHGPLIGGCLSMLAHQLGTPFMPTLKNAILFLEDVGEAPYKIDRYLAQLKQAGIFDQVSAVILGQFLDCTDDNEDRKGIALETILKDYFDHRDYPVIYNFPYGHGMRKFTMPIGVKAELDTEQKQLKLQNPFGQNSV
ncbi:MAG: LD-carboxypeptidase [Caldisericaceae bacterium]|nr:LD-carboxypeptidase [Caldisericaceae bacterium]